MVYKKRKLKNMISILMRKYTFKCNVMQIDTLVQDLMTLLDYNAWGFFLIKKY